MKPRLPVLNSTKNKLLSTVAVTVLAVGSLVYVGVQLERSRYEQPLPANQHCLLAIENSAKLLAGENVDVLAHVEKCRQTSDRVEVLVK